jgi:hypothetical protein
VRLDLDARHSPRLSVISCLQTRRSGFVDGQGIAERGVSRVQDDSSIEIFYNRLVSDLLLQYGLQLTVCCSGTLAGIILAFDSGTPALGLART